MEVKRGDVIYLTGYEDDPRKARPFVVVSNNIGNHFGTICLGVPLTSRHKKLNQPTHCIVKYHDSMAMAEQVHTIDKSDIENVVFQLDKEDMDKLDECLKVSLALIKGFDTHGDV